MIDPDGAVPIDMTPAGGALPVDVPGAGFDQVQAARAKARLIGSMFAGSVAGNLNGARVVTATGYLDNPQPMPVRPNLDDAAIAATVGQAVHAWDGEPGPFAPHPYRF